MIYAQQKESLFLQYWQALASSTELTSTLKAFEKDLP
jgi:hypothetical protein